MDWGQGMGNKCHKPNKTTQFVRQLNEQQSWKDNEGNEEYEIIRHLKMGNY